MTIPPPDKILPDGRGVWVYPLSYGRARLCIGRVGSVELEDGY